MVQDQKSPKIGDTIFRPFDGNKGWTIIDKDVPSHVAWAYVLARCPEANISVNEIGTAQKVHESDSENGWADKIAVVIGGTDFFSLAIVRHDGQFFLLEKQLI